MSPAITSGTTSDAKMNTFADYCPEKSGSKVQLHLVPTVRAQVENAIIRIGASELLK